MIRFLKQLGYGVFYLAVLAAVVFLVYSVFKPVPPPPSEDSSVPEIPAPVFSFANAMTEVSGEEIKVSGKLINESPRVAASVMIKAIIFDKNGFELFSSETFQENIKAYEEREFVVFFPPDRDLVRQFGQDFEPDFSYILEE
jgi:hypothetical protein